MITKHNLKQEWQGLLFSRMPWPLGGERGEQGSSQEAPPPVGRQGGDQQSTGKIDACWQRMQEQMTQGAKSSFLPALLVSPDCWGPSAWRTRLRVPRLGHSLADPLCPAVPEVPGVFSALAPPRSQLDRTQSLE